MRRARGNVRGDLRRAGPDHLSKRVSSGVAGALGALLMAIFALCLSACAEADPTGTDAAEPGEEVEYEAEPVGEAASALVSYNCATHQDTGYSNGSPFAITVVTVDGDPVEIGTANAFLTMAKAAENDGVHIAINSGFRTMAEQQELYSCYINCNCNSCNLAAKPGYSNHQSGHALDLNTSSSGVLNWLNAHGAAYGWKRTVSSEPWHWEWWGGGNPDMYCPTTCDRSAGGFTFSCDGPNAGQTCVNVNEPGDPDSWADNHFCSDTDWGMKWSYAGPIEGMVCTNIAESAEPHAAAWSDNYLCLPQQSPVRFQWNSAGPIAGMSCVHWNETADKGSWGDNYLCVAGVSTFTNGPFTFSSAGPIAGKHCISVDEPADPHTWNDNYFCSDEDLGMKWSYNSPIDTMVCTNIAESAEEHAKEWSDNYLCLPQGAPYKFTWTTAGPLAGKSCVRWYEGSDLAGSWGDNWLCFEETPDVLGPPPQGEGGSGGSGGGGNGHGNGGDGGGGDDGQGTSPSDPSQVSGCNVSSTEGAPMQAWMGALIVALGGARRVRRRRERG
ncbi:D-alanyl-D-alanine carboxypeptidase [Minicystis rosea]|nr:D-alanyl-D-alanine carboxypeptidase [Minicystis rosea]